MNFALLEDGTPTYTLFYKNKAVIKTSKLELELKKDPTSLLNNFTIVSTKNAQMDEPWKPV